MKTMFGLLFAATRGTTLIKKVSENRWQTRAKARPLDGSDGFGQVVIRGGENCNFHVHRRNQIGREPPVQEFRAMSFSSATHLCRIWNWQTCCLYDSV